MLNTETVDPRYADIDSWPIELAVDTMLQGQLSAAAAVQSQASIIAHASGRAADRLRTGGRLVFVGAGTSGRIAVQDGVELGPTFNWPEHRLLFLLAGGMSALAHSSEGAEDDASAAEAAVGEHRVGPQDVVIGCAASGRTPYTIAAINASRNTGALTIAMSNNSAAPLIDAADIGIVLETGSEIVAGSTRMKAGTAQKIALNLLSTAIMLRLGRVYRGMMIDMLVSNAKLRDRARRMIADLANVDMEKASIALTHADDDIKRGVLIARGMEPKRASACLVRNNEVLRDAIAELDRDTG